MPGVVLVLEAVALLDEEAEQVLPLGGLAGVRPAGVTLLEQRGAQELVRGPGGLDVLPRQGRGPVAHEQLGRAEEEQQRTVQENHGCSYQGEETERPSERTSRTANQLNAPRDLPAKSFRRVTLV